MKKLIAVLLVLALPISSVAADIGHKIKYDGGSLSDLKAGLDLRLTIEQDKLRFFKNKTEVGSIATSAVTEISYGQDVHRRVGAAIGIAVFTLGIGALMALSKSKKHFIGLTWDDSGKKGGLAFQADKNDYRGVLTGIEGVTGKKAVNTDKLSVKN